MKSPRNLSFILFEECVDEEYEECGRGSGVGVAVAASYEDAEDHKPKDCRENANRRDEGEGEAGGLTAVASSELPVL